MRFISQQGKGTTVIITIGGGAYEKTAIQSHSLLGDGVYHAGASRVCCAKGRRAAYAPWIAGRILPSPGYKRLSVHDLKGDLCGPEYRI